MDAAINHKEIRTDKGSDFLADDFLCNICVPVPFSISPNKVEPTQTVFITPIISVFGLYYVSVCIAVNQKSIKQYYLVIIQLLRAV